MKDLTRNTPDLNTFSGRAFDLCLLIMLVAMYVRNDLSVINHILVGYVLLTLLVIRLIVACLRGFSAASASEARAASDLSVVSGGRGRVILWLDHGRQLTAIVLLLASIYTAWAGVLLHSGRVDNALMSWLMLNANNYTMNALEKFHNLTAFITAALLLAYLAFVLICWIAGHGFREHKSVADLRVPASGKSPSNA